MKHIAGFTKVHSDKLASLQHCLEDTEIFDVQMLETKVYSLNRSMEYTPGDGNCLFHSVTDQLMNHPTRPHDCDHKLLRFLICQYMKQLKGIFIHFFVTHNT